MTAPATSHTIRGLSPGAHHVRIAAVNDAGEGPWHSLRLRVEGVVVFPGSDWMEVTWQAAPAVARYVVQWRPSTDAAWSEAYEAAAGETSHTVEGLRAGARYDVRVRAEDASGAALWTLGSSARLNMNAHKPILSLNFKLTTDKPPAFAGNIALTAELPRGVAGLDRGVVHWRRSVERYDDARRHEESIAGLTGLYHYFAGLDIRFEYAVRVSLLDRRGRVVGVSEATAAYDDGAYPVGPTRPPRVDAGGLSLLPGATWIDVVWAATVAATGHTVQWKPAVEAGWDSAQQATAAADATGHTLEELTAGGRYTVRVRAHTADGPAPWFGPRDRRPGVGCAVAAVAGGRPPAHSGELGATDGYWGRVGHAVFTAVAPRRRGLRRRPPTPYSGVGLRHGDHRIGQLRRVHGAGVRARLSGKIAGRRGGLGQHSLDGRPNRDRDHRSPRG